MSGRDASQGQGMPGTAAEMPFAWAQALGQVIRVGFEVAGVGDEELELFAEQALAQALPVIHLELHPGLGVAPDKAADGSGNQPRGWGRAAAETQLSRLQAIELADLVGHLLGPADQPARMFQQ